MKLNVSIEIEVEDSALVSGAPPASVDRMFDQIRMHTGWVIRNFDGKLVKFDVKKA